jgi:hypothetical protein
MLTEVINWGMILREVETFDADGVYAGDFLIDEIVDEYGDPCVAVRAEDFRAASVPPVEIEKIHAVSAYIKHLEYENRRLREANALGEFLELNERETYVLENKLPRWEDDDMYVRFAITDRHEDAIFEIEEFTLGQLIQNPDFIKRRDKLRAERDNNKYAPVKP